MNKKIVEVPEDTIEKVDFVLNWITSTLTFWELNKDWPSNLIQKATDECISMLKPYWKDPFENAK